MHALVFFDIDLIADRSTTLPHMLPTPVAFADAVASLGISNGERIVVYDGSGAFCASARLWWTFQVFGVGANVSVLDGGLAEFKANYPHLLESGEIQPIKKVKLCPSLMRAPSSHIYRTCQSYCTHVADGCVGSCCMSSVAESIRGKLVCTLGGE